MFKPGPAERAGDRVHGHGDSDRTAAESADSPAEILMMIRVG